MNTPHIKGSTLGFAKTVLMPGDPLRSKFIAETFLENAELVNNVRGIHGYTGYYKGHKVSVMASGMGMPSIGIYSYELYKFFGVENIIRIGSAGGLAEGLKLRDIVLGIGANTNSSYGTQYGVNGTIAPTCSYKLLKASVEIAEELGIRPVIGAKAFARKGKVGNCADCKCVLAEMYGVEIESCCLHFYCKRACILPFYESFGISIIKGIR